MFGDLSYYGPVNRRIDELKHQVRRLKEARVGDGNDLRYIYDMLDQLEVDIGRSLLLLHSLAEVCVAKGLVTHEELNEEAERLDRLDGNLDGTLDVALFRTPQERQRTPSTKAMLHQLEKGHVSPQEFLADLEDEHRDE